MGAEAEKHLAECKAAAKSCTDFVTDLDARESRLCSLAEDLHTKLLQEGNALLGQLEIVKQKTSSASGKATINIVGEATPAAGATDEELPPPPPPPFPDGDFIPELAQRVSELEERTAALQQMLLAVRDRLFGEEEYDEEAEMTPS